MSVELWLLIGAFLLVLVGTRGFETVRDKQRREEQGDIDKERKIGLLKGSIKPRVYTTAGSISVNRLDIYWSSLTQRYVLAHQFAYANPNKSFENWGGTGETVVYAADRNFEDAKRDIEKMRKKVLEETGVDLNNIVDTERIIETYS